MFETQIKSLRVNHSKLARANTFYLSWSVAAEDVPAKTPLEAACWMLAKWQWPSQGRVTSCMWWTAFPALPPSLRSGGIWWVSCQELCLDHIAIFLLRFCTPHSHTSTIQAPCLAHNMWIPRCLLWNKIFCQETFFFKFRLPCKFARSISLQSVDITVIHNTRICQPRSDGQNMHGWPREGGRHTTLWSRLWQSQKMTERSTLWISSTRHRTGTLCWPLKGRQTANHDPWPKYAKTTSMPPNND